MEQEFLDFASEIIDLANDNYYRMEALRGYCENLDGEKASSTMIKTLLDEICIKQTELIRKADEDSTKLGVKMLI